MHLRGMGTRSTLFARGVVAALLLAPFVSHASATAQEPPSAIGNLQAALARIPPGSTVRVQTRAGEVLEGVLRLAGDSVVLVDGSGRRAIVPGEVRSV